MGADERIGDQPAAEQLAAEQLATEQLAAEQLATVEGVPVGWDRIAELFSLDPTVTYLNHGAFGVVPVPVQRAQRRLRAEMDSNPAAFFTRGLHERLAHTRRHAAQFVGADPELTALVPNVTAATQMVLRTLGIGGGDSVLMTNHGYGATRFAVQRTGAAIAEADVPLEASADEVLDTIVAAARPGLTRLAIIDHVTSATARLFPVRRIVAALRERGIPVFIDAAHGPGMLPLRVAELGADFWAGNLHKWAFAARPTALFAVAAAYRARVVTQTVSWQEPAGFPQSAEFGGTLDYSTWLAAPTGLHLLRTLGLERVRRHNAEVAAHGQRVLAGALGTPAPASPDGVSMRLVRLPAGVADRPEDADALRGRIALELRCEVPVMCWRERGYLRVCGAVYNRPEDYERLAARLPALLHRPPAA